MGILQILATDNFITVNRTVAKIVGLEAAVIFGELASEACYWQQHNPEWDGSFFSTVDNLEERTFLSAHQQRQALQLLQEQGWITVEKRGMPARRFIRMHEAAIIKSIDDQSLKILTTSDEIFEPQDVKKLHGKKNITNNNIKREKREKKETALLNIKMEESGEGTSKEQMEELLQFTAGAYNIKIKDPENTVKAWMATLGQYKPEDITDAIRFHISTNKYFPNPAEIGGNIQKAKLAYHQPEKIISLSQHPDRPKNIEDEQLDDLLNFITIE